MANTYMTGEARRLYYGAESSYGVTPTSALVYAGLLVSLRPKVNFKEEEEYVTDSRGFSQSNRNMVEAGFTYVGKAQAVSGGYSWLNFFAVYAFGATTGIQDGTPTYGRLGSFSALVGFAQAGNTYYNLYNGCMIDQLKISADGAHSSIIFEAEVIAQLVDYSTTKTFTRIQSVTVGADPTVVTTAILRFTGVIQINIAAGGLTNVHPAKWSLTVRNNLTREPGNITGNDTNTYGVAVDISENKREMIFEMTLPRKSETYHNAKIAGSAVTALTIPIGANTLTLSGGVFIADDLGEIKQDLNEETVKIKFNALSIA